MTTTDTETPEQPLSRLSKDEGAKSRGSRPKKSFSSCEYSDAGSTKTGNTGDHEPVPKNRMLPAFDHMRNEFDKRPDSSMSQRLSVSLVSPIAGGPHTPEDSGSRSNSFVGRSQ
jgi:hypothetical protein